MTLITGKAKVKHPRLAAMARKTIPLEKRQRFMEAVAGSHKLHEAMQLSGLTMDEACLVFKAQERTVTCLEREVAE
jgi:hypothetical protein